MIAADRRDGASAHPFSLRLRGAAGSRAAAIDEIIGLIGRERRIERKRDLLQGGRDGEQLLILVDGWACRYRLFADGRRQIAALLLPGDICDLSPLGWNQAASDIAALTPCTVHEIAVRDLHDLMERDFEVTRTVVRLGLAENASLAERNACLGRRSAHEHLAHLLCELFMRLSAIGRTDGMRFPLPITQEAIGDTLGLTAVHVNRVLHQLAGERLIAVENHRVTILDWDRLANGAMFDAGHIGAAAATAGDRRMPAAPATRRERVGLVA